MRISSNKNSSLHYQGCLIGGAIGDALGWPVEFISLNEIRNVYGQHGVKSIDIVNGLPAEISDDTQMTLFTAEGTLRAMTRSRHKGICHLPSVIYNAYLRWLYTQGASSDLSELILTGNLIKDQRLFHRRAPGDSCLSALTSGLVGTMEKPINNSKGCGGVMRVAPIGLIRSIEDPFLIACECAALTHGHPTGYLAAGTFALIIRNLITGYDAIEAVNISLRVLSKYDDHKETYDAVFEALQLAQNHINTIDALTGLGKVGSQKKR